MPLYDALMFYKYNLANEFMYMEVLLKAIFGSSDNKDTQNNGTIDDLQRDFDLLKGVIKHGR